MKEETNKKKLKEKSKLIVDMDDREPKIMEMIGMIEGIDFVRKRLKVGDYVMGNVCVERKEIDDFCCSIMDGRLESQIDRMKEKFEKVYVLVSGSLNSKKSEIHPHCVLGMMASILVRKKIPLVIMEDDYNLIYLMKKIFEKHKSEDDKKLKEDVGI